MKNNRATSFLSIVLLLLVVVLGMTSCMQQEDYYKKEDISSLISALETRIADNRAALDAKTAELEAAHEAAVKALGDEIAANEAEIDALESALATKTAELTAAHEAAVKALGDEIAANQAEIDALESALDAKTAELTAAHEAAVKALGDEIAANQAEIDALESALATKIAELTAAHEAAVKALGDEIAANEAEIDALESALATKTAELTAAHEASVKALGDEIAANKTKIDELKSTLDTKVAELTESFTSSISTLEGLIAKLEATDTDNENRIAELEAEVAELEGKVAELEAALSDDNPQGLAFYLKDDGTYAVEVGNAKYLSTIVIPATYRGKAVTEVGSFNGFAGENTVLTSVTIPASVTSIGNDAFAGCSSLTSITIPESVTSIGDSAFAYCSSLTSITIPDGVTSIGYGAFCDCSSLLNITIPDGVTSIGEWAFFGCSSLENITIPESVTSIGNYAFAYCRGLTGITIPESVTSIGDGAFSDCSSLLSITIPFVGEKADGTGATHFGYIFGASYPDYNDDYVYNDCYVPASLKTVTVTGGTSIGDSAFAGCSGLTSIKIPDGVTSIGSGAFLGCSSLTGITIPEGVTSIGDYVFTYCSSLTSITIPDGVTSIGSCAFAYCTSLLSATFGNNSQLASIGDGAFSDCRSLLSVMIPKGVTSINDYAFYGCSSLASITIPESVTSINDYAFYGCSSLTSIMLPVSVTSIGEDAFRDCSSLKIILIPDNVISIGGSAFSGCSSLTGIIIPEGVTAIGGWAFAGCSSLRNVMLPESITAIDDYAFKGCSSLTGITIPEGVTSIGNYAFSYCSDLTSITYAGSRLQWLDIEKGEGWDSGIDGYSLTFLKLDPEVDVWGAIAIDVQALDESLRTFKFQMSDMTDGPYHVKCTEYMQGPDSLEAAATDIDRLVFERNDAAKQLLGVTISYTTTADNWASQASVIKAATRDSSNPDAADMFVYTMFDMTMACFDGCFRELSTIEGSYFDWTADGWHASVMSDMSFDRQKIYVMASDYFSELWRNMMVLPFNMDMVNAAVSELGPILLPAGQSAPLAGETLSEYLFKMVLDGKWTYDVLIDMCEAIYVDQGVVGKEDINDRIGIYMDTYRGGPAASYLFSSSIRCLYDGVGTGREGVDGGDLRGKYVILIPETGDDMNPIFEAVGELVNINGSMAGNMSGGVNTIAFARGLAMSPGPMLLGELENEDLAGMTDVFSVVPLPLVTEGSVDDYNTYLHNAATLGGFNIYSTKYLAMSAYIQYVSENSAEIKDEYLQIVMKFKNTTFHLGTSQMLDLIYDRVDSVRDMIIDTVLCRRKEKTTMKEAGGRNVTWGALLKNESYEIPTAVANGNAAFLDKYESFYSAKQQSLYELLVEWYALPLAPFPSVDEPVTPPVDEPVTPPVDEPVTPPVDEPVTPPVDEPTDEPTDPPTFRYNEYKARYEYSFDGLNWIAVENYDPASDHTAPLRDTTLSSYSYPMEYVTPAEGMILDSNGKYEVVGNGKYCVALIDITGCVFDKVKLVANETGYEINWCFLTAMPELNKVAPFCEGYSSLVGPEDDPDADEVTIDIPEDARVLVVYYQGWWNHNGNAADAHCPSSITFLKDEEPAAPVIDPNLLDASLTEYDYPMNTITPAEGFIMLEGDNKNVYMVDPLNPDHRVAFIYIEGTVFTGAKFTGNANHWMGWFWLEELPELGETIVYAGDMVNIHETARPSGEQTGKIKIPEGAKWLCVWYQDDADGTAGSEVTNYLPEGILFVDAKSEDIPSDEPVGVPTFRYNLANECFEYSYSGIVWRTVPESAPAPFMVPLIRYNDTDGVYEASSDNGATWQAIESVAGTPMELPAVDPNLLDATLFEYVYPMTQITVSDFCISYFLDEEDPNWNKYMYAEGYSVAIINIEGTVFEKAVFTGNEASYMGWFFLDEMPYPGDTLSKTVHETGRGPGVDTGAVSIPIRAKVLVLLYERPDDYTGEIQNVLPQGICFINSDPVY